MGDLKFEERGVTLVSLVITIIVLLILAGVGLNALFGDSGIIKNAEKAKQETEISNEKELIGQANTLALAQSRTGKITVEGMQIAMNDTAGENAVTAINNGDKIAIKFEKSGRYYNVDENGNIEQFTPYFDATPGELAQNSNSEYMIESIEDLVVFSAMTNGGYKDEHIDIDKNSALKAILMCDLDFKSPLSYGDSTTTIYNGYLGVEDENVPLIDALTNTEKYKGFIPIGIEKSKFNGIFDGQNYYIRNLSQNLDIYAGLFGCINIHASVKNITVTGNIKSTKMAGGIVGWQETQGTTGLIINCTNYADIYGPSAGGIMGYHTGVGSGVVTISGCANYGDVKADSNAGGIIGTNIYGTANMKNCINFGEVIGKNAGGIVGNGYSTNLYSCCTMPSSVVKTFPDSGNAGGMVGFSYGVTKLYNSINLGSVTAGTNARRFYRNQ